MQIPLTLLVNERSVRKDGTCIVYIQYRFSSLKHPLLNTQIEVLPDYWNKTLKCVENRLPEKYGSPGELNFELKRIFRIAEDIVIFATKINLADKVEFVKKDFSSGFKCFYLKRY